MAKIRVLIADDHELLRKGVASVLNQEPDIEVIAQACNGAEAVALFNEHTPDVALIDLSMPGVDGFRAIQTIRARDPKARIIILTTYDTDLDIESGLRAGANGYLLKDVTAADLSNTVREVAKGSSRFAPSVAAKLADRVTRVQLSNRELQILRLVASGKSNKEIADGLAISEATVKAHMTHLFDKLSVTSRTEAVKEGMRRGLVRL